jgi:hypothetical protein
MRARLERDFERFRAALPVDFAGHVRETYRIDLTARYLGFTLPHPIGSGQVFASCRADARRSGAADAPAIPKAGGEEREAQGGDRENKCFLGRKHQSDASAAQRGPNGFT